MMKTSNAVWRLILLSLLAIANLSLSRFTILSFNGKEFNTVKFPVNNPNAVRVTQLQRAFIGDLEFCIDLNQGHAGIYLCENNADQIVWSSPSDWQVKEAFFSDLNQDGNNEVALLIWRPFRPWPVDRFLSGEGRISSFHDKNGMSCHVILVGPVNGQFKELWAGSAMVEPIRNLEAVDLDKDGLQELVGIEYPYDASLQSGALVVWDWNGFGFSLASRLSGRFSSFLVLLTTINTLLIVH